MFNKDSIFFKILSFLFCASISLSASAIVRCSHLHENTFLRRLFAESSPTKGPQAPTLVVVVVVVVVFFRGSGESRANSKKATPKINRSIF